jgi:hypothetical protein
MGTLVDGRVSGLCVEELGFAYELFVQWRTPLCPTAYLSILRPIRCTMHLRHRVMHCGEQHTQHGLAVFNVAMPHVQVTEANVRLTQQGEGLTAMLGNKAAVG